MHENTTCLLEHVHYDGMHGHALHPSTQCFHACIHTLTQQTPQQTVNLCQNGQTRQSKPSNRVVGASHQPYNCLNNAHECHDHHHQTSMPAEITNSTSNVMSCRPATLQSQEQVALLIYTGTIGFFGFVNISNQIMHRYRQEMYVQQVLPLVSYTKHLAQGPGAMTTSHISAKHTANPKLHVLTFTRHTCNSHHAMLRWHRAGEPAAAGRCIQ